MEAALRWLAEATPGSAELLRLMDATPVPCGQSAVTAKRSGLFGWAGYGYCPSHSRWYWGAKLLLICTCDGTVTGFGLANPKREPWFPAAFMTSASGSRAARAQGKALQFPAAERAVPRPAPLAQPELLQQPGAVTGPQEGEQIKGLGRPQPVRQRRILQLAAGERPQPRSPGDGAVAEHTEHAAIWPAQPLGTLDGCRLPGTVGVGQADDLTALDIEVQPVGDDPGPARLA